MSMIKSSTLNGSSCKSNAVWRVSVRQRRFGRVVLGLVSSLCVLGGALACSSAPALAAGPPVLEEDGSVLSVTSTSAKLQAQINPEESNTTYHFEYDTKPYAAGEAPHGTSVPIPDGSLGAGSTGVTVRGEPEGLSPS